MKTIFTPLGNRDLLSKAVASKIEEAIRSGKILPDSKLPSEFELCDQFNVSRTAVREAIRTLSARGLVTVEKGRGIFVKNITADSVTDPMHLYLQMQFSGEHALHLVHARQVIEPPIAASAALFHTDEDAAKLIKNLEDLKRSDNGFAELARLDMEFHLNVAKASENPIIPLLLEPIHRLMPKIKSSVYAVVDDAKQSAVIWHGKILTSILARDAEGARQAMLDHLGIAESHIRKMLELKPSEKSLD